MNRSFVDGSWCESTAWDDVLHPFSGDRFDIVGAASVADVERALASAARAATPMAQLSLHERASILDRAATLLEAETSDLARVIVGESGKPITEATAEAARIPEIFRLCAEESRRIHGETIPLGAVADGVHRVGYTTRSPLGVVVAITPYNYPALLVAHKVGPALAAGNAVILKPSPKTPLTALRLVDALARAGVPTGGIQCLVGNDPSIGSTLVTDVRTNAITFTGSTSVGTTIARAAGARRMLLEMGGNCALVVAADADLELAAAAAVRGGFVNAGQVCISVQRVIAHQSVIADLVDAMAPLVRQLKTGDPFDEATDVSSVVSAVHAERVHSTITHAKSQGARVVAGGDRLGSLVEPTLVADVDRSSSLFTEELFGPAIAVTAAADDDEAICLANATTYGLAAAIYTADLTRAMRFVDSIDAGAVHVNGGPLWRADMMPYGGVKGSGHGKEGPRYAIEDLTDLKMVAIHLGSRAAFNSVSPTIGRK